METSSGGGASSAGSTGSGGTTTGASTGDTGPCLPLGTGCAGNPSCCSGSCDVTCLEPEGQHCSGPSDCSSQNCVEAGYSGDAGPCMAFGGACVSDAQCCNGACNGTCGQALGQSCLNDPDCSSRTCTNGQCACATTTANQSWDCASAQDCCGGLGCQHYFNAADGGTLCCSQPGTSCDASDGVGPEFGCCGTCTNGTCACVTATNPCTTDQSCCAGGACLTRVAGDSASLACCQVGGQFCLSDPECCSESCGKDQKCD